MVTVRWRYNGEEYQVVFSNEGWQEAIDRLKSGDFEGCPLCVRDENGEELCNECEVAGVAYKMFPEYDRTATSCCKLRSLFPSWNKAVTLSWNRARGGDDWKKRQVYYNVLAGMRKALKTGEARIRARHGGNGK